MLKNNQNVINKDQYMLSNFLVESLIKLEPLIYINPVNENEMKKLFLSKKIEEPIFFYKKPRINFDKINSLLEKIPSQKGIFGNFLNNKKKQLIFSNKIIQNLGSENFFDVSRSFFGLPSKELVKKANKILSIKSKDLVEEKNINSLKVKKIFEKELKKYGLTKWKVELVDKNITTVYASEKKITLGKKRLFSNIEVKRLLVHEIGVHVLRSENGFNQPFSIMGSGLFPYIDTEEGLAALTEEICGLSDIQKIKEYAARVIAVDNLSKKYSFRECFNDFIKRGFDEDASFKYTIRAYRGGGFTKDYLYLKGYFEIKEFYKTGGDLKELYYGVFGLSDLKEIKLFANKGILNKPKIIPFHLRNK